MNFIDKSRRKFMSTLLSALAVLSCPFKATASNNSLINIIHFNDIHGFIKASDSAIGYPKIAGFIEAFKKEHPNTLVLDAGDAFAGSAYTSYKKANPVLQIMNTVGIDAMAAGNADFVLGAPELVNKASAASFPIISANIIGEDGQTLLPPSVIVRTASGFKAGIIGLSPPQVIANKSGKPNIDIVEAAQKEIDALTPHVDMVIALAHLGDSAKSTHTSLRLARETRGLHLIVDGHSHSTLPEGRIENGILIVQAGEFSKYVGLVQIDIKNGQILNQSAQLFSPKDLAAYPDKPETAKALDAVIAESDAYFSQIIGSTGVFLDGKREHVRVGETNLGNLMADALREDIKTDIAIVGAYAIGGEFKPGEINRENFLILMRIDANISVLEAKGSEIQTSLEEFVELWPEASGYFPQVSGLSFELHANAAKKIRNIKVNGQAIDLNASYSVATFQNLAAKGGLAKAKVIKHKASSFESALLAYFEKHSPVAPKVEGRITCYK